MVGRHPHNLAARLALGDIVLLVAGYRGDIEALSVIYGGLSVAVDYVVDCTVVASVEDIRINQVLCDERLVRNLCHPVCSILADGDDFTQVRAVADILSAIVFLKADADEALCQVGIKLGVVVDNLGGCDGLEVGDFRLAGEEVPVFFLKGLEPVDGVPGKMLQLVPEVCNLLLYAADSLFHGLDVELGNLAHRLLHKLKDIVHYNLAVNLALELLHGLEYLLKLNLPSLLVLLQDFVNAVLEEDSFKGVVMPVVLQLVQANLKLAAKELLGVVGAVFQHVVYAQELRLVVYDNAGVGRDCSLAVREGVKCINRLVRGYIVGKVNHNLYLLRSHILYFLNLDFALVLCLQDGVYHLLGGLSVRNLRYGDGILVNLLNARAYLYNTAALAGHVFGALREAAGREVRENLVGLSLKDGDGCIQKFVEVMRENLGSHTHGNALSSLRQKQRETYRELRRLLVAAVIGRHPVGNLRVEYNFLCELAQAGLYVSGGRIAVTGEDVTPVTLAVYGKALLAQLDQGSKDGCITVRVILHGLSYDVRNLCKAAVVHLVHGVEHTPLYGLQSVHDVRDGPGQDYIG